MKDKIVDEFTYDIKGLKVPLLEIYYKEEV